jgi:hypothetical protein
MVPRPVPARIRGAEYMGEASRPQASRVARVLLDRLSRRREPAGSRGICAAAPISVTKVASINSDTTFVSNAAEGLFAGYNLDAAADEMFDRTGRPLPQCRSLFEELRSATAADLAQRQLEADKAFLTQGITFTVYGDDQGTERIFPFDLLPRIITADEWAMLERGLAQRLTAVNLFSRTSITKDASSPKGSFPATSCSAAGITGARCAASASIATSTSRWPAPI